MLVTERESSNRLDVNFIFRWCLEQYFLVLIIQ